MALGKGTATKAFNKNNVSASLNTSMSAHRRKNNQLSDIAKIYDDLNKEFGNLKLPGNIQKEILTEAAEIGVLYTRLSVPKAEKDVKFYKESKNPNGKKSPAGKGVVKKTIKPGHLGKFIKIFTHGVFKKINHAVFYGPKYPQVAYAHLPHFGSKFIKKITPYMEIGFIKAKGEMMRYIKARYKDEMQRAWNNSIKTHLPKK